MPALDTLHNELRVRIPNKPYEFYNDALRWSINEICIKTAMWEIMTTIVTEPDVSVYDIDLPAQAVIHSNLYIVQKGEINQTSGKQAADRVIVRPTNGFTAASKSGAPSDYLQAFDTVGSTQIAIFPAPVDGGRTLEVYTAIKPKKGADNVSNNKLFEEYADIVVEGALYRLHKGITPELAMESKVEFRNGCDSIHVDVIKQNANTPLKVSALW